VMFTAVAQASVTLFFDGENYVTCHFTRSALNCLMFNTLDISYFLFESGEGKVFHNVSKLKIVFLWLFNNKNFKTLKYGALLYSNCSLTLNKFVDLKLH